MDARFARGRQVFVLAILCALVACGGKDASRGVTPSPVMTGVAISGSAVLKIGQSETYAATATYSNNTTQEVSPTTWASDNNAVVTIDGTGRAQAMAAGLATITAVHEGMSARPLLARVVPDYQGTWEGDYTVTRCEHTGDFREAEACGPEGFRVGDRLPIGLEVTQSGRQLTGALHLGELNGPLNGQVEDGGTATGTASITFTADGLAVSMAITPLQLRADGDRLTGSFTADATAVGASGHFVLGASLRTVVRTSSSARSLAVMRPVFPTLREAFASSRQH